MENIKNASEIASPPYFPPHMLAGREEPSPEEIINALWGEISRLRHKIKCLEQENSSLREGIYLAGRKIFGLHPLAEGWRAEDIIENLRQMSAK